MFFFLVSENPQQKKCSERERGRERERFLIYRRLAVDGTLAERQVNGNHGWRPFAEYFILRVRNHSLGKMSAEYASQSIK